MKTGTFLWREMPRKDSLNEKGYVYSSTVEPRFNEVSRDWGNWFVISRFFSMHYTITGLKSIVCYTEEVR